MPKQRPTTKQVKQNDPNKSDITRFTDVYIPKKEDNTIRPEKIFEGFKKQTKTKKRPTKTKSKTRAKDKTQTPPDRKYR